MDEPQSKSCAVCRWSKTRFGYLGPRVYCSRYKQYRSMFCIDFVWRLK